MGPRGAQLGHHLADVMGVSHAAIEIPHEPGGDGPRVLIVDDDRDIHGDYVRCLTPPRSESRELGIARDALFGPGSEPPRPRRPRFELAHAYAGADALELVRRSIDDGVRYAVAFVDMRMPPGWNGVETIREIWRIDSAIQVVVSTAFSDFTWDKVIAGVGGSEGLHLLRKPFAADQVRVFAEVLSKKWQLARSTANPRPKAAP
jgi:CheY-like chemotaxis protein